jgi:hypothetical protein
MSCPEHPQWVHDVADCPLCAARRAERDLLWAGAEDSAKMVDEMRAQIEQLQADAERERLARRVVDDALRQAIEERDRERVLVEAVGRDVCELALKVQRRAHGTSE